MSARKNISQRHIDRPWGRFVYRDTGSGTPVILLHGEGSDHGAWSEIIPHIKNSRIIIPDLCGHGESSVPQESPTLNGMVDDVMKIIRNLWLGKVNIVGHSLGGIIAQQILRRFPESVAKIILLEGWVNLKYSHVLSDSMTECLSNEHAEAITRKVHNTFVRWMPAFRDEFWATAERCDTEELLRQTSHEVLHIYGARGNDEVAAEKIGIHTKENVSLAWIKDAGHFLHLSHSKEVGEIIKQFLFPQQADASEENNPSIPVDLMGLYNYRTGQR